jgi:hypothetical protein
MLTESQIRAIHAGSYPSEDYKHATILEYARRFQTNVFIETGTYLGDTVQAVKNCFSQVYSIELGPNLYQNAWKRFAHDPNVTILLGNSEEVLKQLLPMITERPLFYLDSHFKYDADSPEAALNPTLGELDAIFTLCPNSVVLIDDARLFTGKPLQPNCSPEISVLEKYVKERMPNWVFEVEQDIMRLHQG